jgi:hypothetical protein
MLSCFWNRSRLVTLLWCAVFLVGAHVPSRAFGQPQPTVGRFEVVAGPAPTGDSSFYLIDTTTGRCWWLRTEREEWDWGDLQFPIKETKVENGGVGRFRLTVTPPKRGSDEAVSLVVSDTASGRCWGWRGNFQWRVIPAPPSKK